jgi:hypothetical protein
VWLPGLVRRVRHGGSHRRLGVVHVVQLARVKTPDLFVDTFAQINGPLKVLGALDLPSGSIHTAALANSAVTQGYLAVGGTSDPTTTSGTLVTVPEMQIDFTCEDNSLVEVHFSGTFLLQAVAGAGLVQATINGIAAGPLCYNSPPIGQFFSVGTMCLVVLNQGTYSARGVWAYQVGSGGNLRSYGGNRQLQVLVHRR